MDINPEAVDICHLRLWLSLVLDMPDPKHVEPLPNLDFRIVAGDSLIDRLPGIPLKESLPQGEYQPPLELGRKVDYEERRIDQWRREFDSIQDDHARLRELRGNIARAQVRIIHHHLDAAIEQASHDSNATNRRSKGNPTARLAQLEAQKAHLDSDAPFQSPFLWPTAFPEVFQHQGFDIVLANPPYIEHGRIAKQDKELFKESFKNVYTGTPDILVFFYARAIQLLRPGGWLSFITSNKYMRATYGEGLREHLSKSVLFQRVIDFGDLPLFEANGKPVAAYPAVTVGKAATNGVGHTLRVVDLTIPIRASLAAADLRPNAENTRLALENLPGLLEQHEQAEYPASLLNLRGWILEDPALVRLFERLMSQGTPLGEFTKGRMYRGVLTGLNEAFVIDQSKRDELVAEDPRNAEIIKPWLRGQDIKRWKADWAGLYVLFTRRGIDIDKYPAVKNHLLGRRAQLEPKTVARQPGPGRKPGPYKWYEIQDSIAYYSEFARPKVIWPDISKTMRFAWDESGAFSGNTTYFSAVLPKWSVAVMNSIVFEFMLCLATNTIRGGFSRLFTESLEVVPLPSASLSAQQQLTSNMESEALRLGRHDDSLIDQLVAEAYGLGADDLNTISDWALRRSLPITD